MMDDETVYGTADDGGVSVMSERVQALASSIYREFERMIKGYDEDVVKELMPLVVSVLENLDGTVAENKDYEVELELLKDDNEQLITQYEREKQLRKQAEQKFLEYEDANDQEKRALQGRKEALELTQKQMTLKVKNYADQVARHEYRESEMKQEYMILQKRHNEVLQKYMEHVERLKIVGQTDVVGSPRLNLNRPHSPVLMDHEEGGVTNDGKVDDSLASPSARKKNFQPNEIGNDSNLHHEIMTSPDREIHNEKSKKTPQKTIETQAGVDTSNAATVTSPQRDNRTMSPELAAIVDSTPELKDKTKRPNYMPELRGDGKGNTTIYDELDPSLITEMDEGANISDVESYLVNQYKLSCDSMHAFEQAVDPSEFSVMTPDNFYGMGKEVENILEENSELRATKNALNVVKDDLIAKVDELMSEIEVQRQEINGLQTTKGRLNLRITELEEEMKKLREENDKVAAVDEDDGVPMAQRKRFTRVEMARVLMERNQYKERLMELQEAVRWTEMIRASREHPSFEGKKNKSSVWKFFSNLFSTTPAAPPRKPGYPHANIRYNAPTSHVTPTGKQRSQTIASLDNRTKAFEFLDDSDNQRNKDKREQYKKVKAHVRQDDGRVQAYGWSLPAKLPSPPKGPSQQPSNLVGVPVPVFCRPLAEKELGTKIWCAAGVNLTGGRTRDGGSIVGASVFYSSTLPEQDTSERKERSNSELDRFDDQITKQQKEICESLKNQLSSLVWICTTNHDVSKVTVIDANQPQALLDAFPVKNPHILCIASVPGAMESDYPSEDIEAADDTASVNSVTSGGSDTGVGTVTLVTVNVPITPRSSTPSSEKGDGSQSEDAAEFKAEVGDTNFSNIASVKDVEQSITTAATTAPLQDTVGMEGLVREQHFGRNGSTSSTDTETSGDPLGVTNDSIPTEMLRRHRSSTAGASDLLKDGLSAAPTENDVMYEEAEKMSSIKPTMWLGAQDGWLLVHSAVSQWRRCLHSIKLKESILSIVHTKGRVLAALANGTLAVFHRSTDGQWDLNNYHILDLGRPQQSIRCMVLVYDRMWCGLRNKVHVIHPQTLKVERSFDAHPRKESQVRQLAWQGDGVWVSIRLDSTLRLYHAHTYQHLQDVDIEPYVSKMLGTGKLGFSFVRITALMIACNRLWVGTGNGVIISIPLTESTKPTPAGGSRPGAVIRVYSDSRSDNVRPGNVIPFCSITQAQLSFHGHRDAVKFFVAIPGTAGSVTTTASGSTLDTAPGKSAMEKAVAKNMLVMSGGEGYIDFRAGDGDDEDENASSNNYGDELTNSSRVARNERSHLIVWQVAGVTE
ncbi:C-Jun-amino-terminal kinase-interacting protein 4-like isoform X2 [Asterias rubens]|uniref:C-Jun-amino-terminal kinase-interacting protein 4-like isoform X2 n=1 Tax=Asterias rubens TaxID=7604 RepID=UPI001455A7F0|nr:C-Jun-amino-terminal kinase-interacting protein 4-like isoform X2 [Asterias rubens]